MNCPKCDIEQPDDAKFCLACGTDLASQELPIPDLEGQKVIARLLSRDDVAPFIERWGETHTVIHVVPFARSITEDAQKTVESLAVALVVMEKR